MRIGCRIYLEYIMGFQTDFPIEVFNEVSRINNPSDLKREVKEYSEFFLYIPEVIDPASALMGGISADLAGGDFWRGFATGATVAGANHLMHPDPLSQFKKDLR